MPAKSKRNVPPRYLSFHSFAILTIFAVGICIYSNSLKVPFIFDDRPNIVDNPAVHLTSLTPERIHHACFAGYITKRRPLAYLSFALNYYAGGYNETGYHIVNIVIHVIGGTLVYFLALLTLRLAPGSLKHGNRQVEDSMIKWTSLFAALLFTAHPLQTQAVTYIVQRMTSLATMFCLLSLLLYILGRSNSVSWQRWALWSGGLLSWILSLATKEIGVVLPFLILLYEWFFFQKLSSTWIKKSALWGLAAIGLFGLAAYLYMGFNAFEVMFGGYEQRDFTMGERVMTQFRVLVFYLSLVLLPLPGRLNLGHDIALSHSLIDPASTLVCLLLLTGLFVLAIFLARRQPVVSFCLLWFFVTHLLESTVISLELIYEHRMYLPMFGICLALSYLVFAAFGPRRQAAIVTMTLAILLLGIATYTRNEAWNDRVTFWSDVVEKSPQSPRAYLNRGNEIERLGDPMKALMDYNRALELKDDFPEGYYNRGNAYSTLGKTDEAMADYKSAIKFRPEYFEAYGNLGLIYESQGKLNIARDHYEKAIEINPAFAAGHLNLGVLNYKERKFEDATYHLIESLRYAPHIYQAYNNLAAILIEQKNFVEAEKQLYKALQWDPGYVDAHFNFGRIAELTGRRARAITCFKEALKYDPYHQPSLHRLQLLLSPPNKKAAQ